MNPLSMTVATRPRILVTGATGAQGGSVLRALLAGGLFDVRAMTRTPRSRAADALRALGAEVVGADMFDRESVIATMNGCHGAFVVTSYWEHFEREEEHGMNLVEAAAGAGVRHLVLSTLPPIRTLTGGALNVPDFDIKARVADRARELGIPSTFVQVAYYYENFTTFFVPQPQPDGTYVFAFPQGDTKLAGASAEDVGPIVAQVFAQRDEFLGRSLYVVGDDLRADEYAAILSRAVRREIRYRHIDPAVFAAYGFRGAGGVADMFTFYREHVPNRQADLEQSRALHPGIQSFATWATRNAARITDLLDATRAA